VFVGELADQFGVDRGFPVVPAPRALAVGLALAALERVRLLLVKQIVRVASGFLWLQHVLRLAGSERHLPVSQARLERVFPAAALERPAQPAIRRCRGERETLLTEMNRAAVPVARFVFQV